MTNKSGDEMTEREKNNLDAMYGLISLGIFILVMGAVALVFWLT